MLRRRRGQNGHVTHGDGLSDVERRRGRRRSRLGVLGVALFVGGPVLGTALAVAGVVVGLREDPRWGLLVLAGACIGFGFTFAGLRVLAHLEQARSVDEAPAGHAARSGHAAPPGHAVPSGHAAPSDPAAQARDEEVREAAGPSLDGDRASARPDQPDSASPGRTSPDS